MVHNVLRCVSRRTKKLGRSQTTVANRNQEYICCNLSQEGVFKFWARSCNFTSLKLRALHSIFSSVNTKREKCKLSMVTCRKRILLHVLSSAVGTFKPSKNASHIAEED